MPQDVRGGRDTAQTIGFHELRQACEISALRQDLERLIDETCALRAYVDEQVEQVSGRFAALTPGDLASAARMLPLLEHAVTTLVGIRDAARRASLATGAVPDDQRPAPPRLRGMEVPPTPPVAVPAPSMPAPPAAPPPPAPMAAAAPPPAPAAAPSPILATPADSLLMAPASSQPAPPPRPAGPAAAVSGNVAAPVWVLPAAAPAAPRPARRAEPPKEVDWLGRGKGF